MDVLKKKLKGKKNSSKYNMTSDARVSNQSVPNHASEDMIFIAGFPDNIVVVQEKMRGEVKSRSPMSNTQWRSA